MHEHSLIQTHEKNWPAKTKTKPEAKEEKPEQIVEDKTETQPTESSEEE